MKMMTTFELFAKEKGRDEGIIMGKIEALKEMFQKRYLPKKQFEQMLKPLQMELARLT